MSKIEEIYKREIRDLKRQIQRLEKENGELTIRNKVLTLHKATLRKELDTVDAIIKKTKTWPLIAK